MKTENFHKILNYVLTILALILFGATDFAQTSPPANGIIAFTSVRNGNKEIYTINADGSGLRRLTFDATADDYPAFSPDGTKIAYLSQASGQNFIKTINAASGTEQRIITQITFDLTTNNFCGEDFALSWSPDGTKIAFQEFGDIFTINADGSNRQNVTNSPARDSQPAWSPTGVIAYASTLSFGDGRNGLDIKTTNGGIFAQFGYFTCSSSPVWSPDSATLAYIHGFDLNRYGLIVTERLNPPFQQDFFRNTCCGSKLTQSPDGNFFALDSFNNEGVVIQIFDRSGENRRVLINGANPSWGREILQPLSAKATADFDGDGRSDISVFRPSDRTWYLNQSTQGVSATQWGFATDKITPADFDGDGKTDLAVYRDGTWFWLASSDNSYNTKEFGLASDIPVPADFNGDGKSELAIYRNGTWWILNLANNQISTVQFGLPTDKPVVADYDGDGRADQAVYRNGEWHLNRSSQGYAVINFGLATDKPVVADYDGDGRADQAVYRNGTWYILRSSQGFTAFQYGLATDIPAPADYDGDGRTDAAVFRDGVWYLRQSTNGISIQQFGLLNDKPIPAAYLP